MAAEELDEDTLQMLADPDMYQIYNLPYYNFIEFGRPNYFPIRINAQSSYTQHLNERVNLLNQLNLYSHIRPPPANINTIRNYLRSINTYLEENAPPPQPSRRNLNLEYDEPAGAGLKPTRWTDFVRKYAKKHNITYGCAVSKASEEYKKHKGIVSNIKSSIGKKEEFANRYLSESPKYGIKNRVLRKGTSIVRR